MKNIVPPYDPSLLVRLFSEKMNDSEEAKIILANLKKCIQPFSYCDCGCDGPYFIDPKSAEYKIEFCLNVWHQNTLYFLKITEQLEIASIEIQNDFPMPLEAMVNINI